MLQPKLVSLITSQIALEAKNSQFYAALDFWARLKGWRGVQDYFEEAAKEETRHKRRWMKFLTDYADLPVKQPAIAAQEANHETLLEAFQAALKAELDTTEAIERIAAEADAQDNTVAEKFVSVFLDEQRESVEELRDIVRRLQLARNEPGALMLVDKFIGKLA